MDAGNEDDLAAAAALDHVASRQLAHVKAADERRLDDALEGRGSRSRNGARMLRAGLLTRMSMCPSS